MSGLIHDRLEPERVRFGSSMYVYDQTLEMVQRLFSTAVAIQAADAQIKAAALAAVLGARVDSSSHPSSGPRPECDDMLNIIEQLAAPLGREPSLWAGEEMGTAVARLQGPPCVLCLVDESGLAVEFPLFDRTMLLTMKTSEEHPQLGNGLFVWLALPFSRSEGEDAKDAANLNMLELCETTRVPYLGGWRSSEDGISYVGFYPNATFVPGLLWNLVMYMVGRARWVAETVFEDSWESSYERAVKEKWRMLSRIFDSKDDRSLDPHS